MVPDHFLGTCKKGRLNRQQKETTGGTMPRIITRIDRDIHRTLTEIGSLTRMHGPHHATDAHTLSHIHTHTHTLSLSLSLL